MAERKLASQITNRERVDHAHVLLSTLWEPSETQKQVKDVVQCVMVRGVVQCVVVRGVVQCVMVRGVVQCVMCVAVTLWADVHSAVGCSEILEWLTVTTLRSMAPWP